MIVLYKGRRGCGKTLTLVKDGYKFFKEGYKVLRNFECSFGSYIDNEDIVKLDKSSLIKDCVLLIDEIQIFFDARMSMRKQNIQFSNFIQQSRKRNIHILCTTQYANTIDMRLRQHLDVIAYPNFLKEFNVCEVRYYDLTKQQDDLLGTGIDDGILVIYNAEPIFKLYKTEEMIV